MMRDINFEFLMRNKLHEFDSGEFDFALLSKYKQLVKDEDYFNFIIESKNGGFFYTQSLHLYGFSGVHKFNDIDYVNSLFRTEYNEIFKDLISFGQDLFGNQFCFDLAENNIIFFDSETGERQTIASDYLGWMKILNERVEYFSGVNILKSWLLNNQFNFDQRLCPKIPFLMGGEFIEGNLYAGRFPDYIRAYANIANQVFGLPEGTKIQLNINRKP